MKRGGGISRLTVGGFHRGSVWNYIMGNQYFNYDSCHNWLLLNNIILSLVDDEIPILCYDFLTATNWLITILSLCDCSCNTEINMRWQDFKHIYKILHYICCNNLGSSKNNELARTINMNYWHKQLDMKWTHFILHSHRSCNCTICKLHHLCNYFVMIGTVHLNFAHDIPSNSVV